MTAFSMVGGRLASDKSEDTPPQDADIMKLTSKCSIRYSKISTVIILGQDAAGIFVVLPGAVQQKANRRARYLRDLLSCEWSD